MKRILSMSFVFMLLLSVSFSTVAFASDTTNTGTETNTETTADDVLVEDTTEVKAEEEILDDDIFNQKNDVDDIIDGGVVGDTVTIDDITAKVESKFYDIIKFFQTIAQPGAVIVFIVGLIMVVFGALGNHGLMGKGFVVMIFAVLAYFGILFAEQIVEFFKEWLRN